MPLNPKDQPTALLDGAECKTAPDRTRPQMTNRPLAASHASEIVAQQTAVSQPSRPKCHSRHNPKPTGPLGVATFHGYDRKTEEDAKQVSLKESTDEAMAAARRRASETNVRRFQTRLQLHLQTEDCRPSANALFVSVRPHRAVDRISARNDEGTPLGKPFPDARGARGTLDRNHLRTPRRRLPVAGVEEVGRQILLEAREEETRRVFTEDVGVI
ncbi:hypothetical protein L596_013053 [Steinernema carpocapsae]|uniref:Uncharacterized protein n=1 Tax=Steinernema carpocapsae TaxID=34508 RepID=A0A4U5NZ28_STECR|nr:hypothetical protein L596_013053 [Steinernema carpocapsae]